MASGIARRTSWTRPLPLLFLLLLLMRLEQSSAEVSDVLMQSLMKNFELESIPNPAVKAKDVAIPDVLLELHKQHSDMDINTTNFGKPGYMLGPSNSVRAPKGRLMAPRLDKAFEKNARILRSKTNWIVEGDCTYYHSHKFEVAYLRVYWKPHLTITRKKGSFMASASDLVCYNKDPEKQIKTLLDVKKIYHRNATIDEGWYDFDVTSALSRCASQKLDKLRIVILKGQMTLKSDPSISIIPEGIFKKPLFYVYSETASHRANREKRANNGRRPRRKHPRRKKGRHQQSCALHSMRVDFKDVGWSDWIFSPTFYDANVCLGECRFPLPDHANTTNHAIVQTMVNGVNPSTVPQACCIPTEMSPISMLYLDEYGVPQLKTYDNMVAEACGCR